MNRNGDAITVENVSPVRTLHDAAWTLDTVAHTLAASSTLLGTLISSSISESRSQLESSTSRFHHSLQDALGLNIHGLISANYQRNFDNPRTGNNLFRAYDFFGTNSFELSQVELHIDRTVPNQLGFVLDLNSANVAQVQYGLTSYWREPKNPAACRQSPCGWLDPTQAFLVKTIPIGNGIVVSAGKQFGLIGYEVIPSYQNVNLFQSIGLLFNLGEPFTVTGLRLDYPVNQKLMLSFGVNNGWDVIASSTYLQNLEGRIAYRPFSWSSYTLNAMFGPTQPNQNSKRGMIDNILTIMPPIKGLSITEEYYFAHQDANAVLPTPLIQGPGDSFNPLLNYVSGGVIPHAVQWQGAGTWIGYWLTDRLQLGLRGEWLDDSQGFRTGFPEQLWEITTGFNYMITEYLMSRFEYRHDESSAKPFPSGKPFVTFPCPGLGACTSTSSTYSGMDTLMTSLIFTY